MDIVQSSGTGNNVTHQASGYTPQVKVVGASAGSSSQTLPSEKISVSKSQVREAVDKINDVLQTMTSADLKFSVDEETGINIVQVVDKSTHEVIRQIPSKEVVSIASGLGKLQGLLIKRSA